MIDALAGFLLDVSFNVAPNNPWAEVDGNTEQNDRGEDDPENAPVFTIDHASRPRRWAIKRRGPSHGGCRKQRGCHSDSWVSLPARRREWRTRLWPALRNAKTLVKIVAQLCQLATQLVDLLVGVFQLAREFEEVVTAFDGF